LDWNEVIETYGSRLLLHARQRCPSRADAEDAVQGGLIRIWQRRRQLDEGSIALLFTAVNGKRSVRATGRDGAVLFDGPIASDEDLAKVPAELRESVDRVLEMEENRFRGILGAADPAPYDRAPPPEPAITLKIQDMPLEAALDMLSRISGIPVEIRGGPLPETTVSAEMVNTPFREALEYILKRNGLSYAMADGRVVITVGGR